MPHIPIKDYVNPAYYNIPVEKGLFEEFKKNLLDFYNNLRSDESEEYNKNLISQFLYKSFYEKRNYINTFKRADLVIHNSKSPDSPIAVILETKKITNLSEFPSEKKLNTKALQELVYYYLEERILNKNYHLKHLIITNGLKWYFFDSTIFEEFIYQNKSLVKDFLDFKKGTMPSSKTTFFYNEIAKLHLETILDEDFKYCMIDLNILDNISDLADSEILNLYKLFSPQTLIKLPFENDSNSLNKEFYSELLHIMGVKEKKDKSKKILVQQETKYKGTLIENIILQIKNLNKLHTSPIVDNYGETEDERCFNLAMELAIIWLNRLLFLKLLEGQIISYNNSKDYAFLNSNYIKNFSDFNKLFFEVLALKESDRSEYVNEFKHVPYLNSSLFEQSNIENQMFFISQLQNIEIPYYSKTVLKDLKGKPLKGTIKIVDYILQFFDSYDFGSDTSNGKIKEQRKTIINASVLGLIFEKINGYKDGAFFTPGVITMRMSKKIIRQKVIDKFNIHYKWQVKNFNELYNKIEDLSEANELINSLKICDPAVGSGHFLVSALNELLAVKSELKILMDRKGRRLKEISIAVENDELLILNEDGTLFKYNKNSKESQNIQETIFFEKKLLIENCIFGVDINPNSVNICKLRLWIELLKNTFYIEGTDYLETLPNIDINIKIGNSLISKFNLNSSITNLTKKTGFTVNDYINANKKYRNAKSKKEKREVIELIQEIKNKFESSLTTLDPRIYKYSELQHELNFLENQDSLFKLTPTEAKTKNNQINDLKSRILKLETELSNIRENKIFVNSFEWRFEFPEILNNKGLFEGFDIILGNPPYGVSLLPEVKKHLQGNYNFFQGNFDIYSAFIEQSLKLLKKDGYLSFIIPVSWQTGTEYFSTRKDLLLNYKLIEAIKLPYNIFEDAFVDTGIYTFKNRRSPKNHKAQVYDFPTKYNKQNLFKTPLQYTKLSSNYWEDDKEYRLILNPTIYSLFNKINNLTDLTIGQLTHSVRGILANDNDISDTYIEGYKKLFVGDLYRYQIAPNFKYVKYGANLKEYPRDFKYFTGTRIIVRRIISRKFRIMANIVEEEFVNKKDIYTFIPTIATEFNIYYLLAIMNSKLAAYLVTKASTTASKNDYSQVSLTELRNIPVVNIASEKQNELIIITKQIMELYSKNFKLVKKLQTTLKLNLSIEVPLNTIDSVTLDEFLNLIKTMNSVPISLEKTEQIETIYTQFKLKLVENIERTKKTEQELDRLIYHIFDLNPKEIKLIEDAYNEE